VKNNFMAKDGANQAIFAGAAAFAQRATPCVSGGAAAVAVPWVRGEEQERKRRLENDDWPSG